MKNQQLGLLLLIALVLPLACSKERDMYSKQDNVVSFTIGDDEYTISKLDVMDYSHTVDPHLTIKVDSGSEHFEFFISLDMGQGEYGMSATQPGYYFEAAISNGFFYTQDAGKCRISVEVDDLENKYFQATFNAICETWPPTDSIQVSNGLIKLKYED